MNNLSLIIGIVLIVISIILIFVGGWEKFHLERENNAWLALFIVGWIIFVAGAALILLGIFSNKKTKIPENNVNVITKYGVEVPLPTVKSLIGSVPLESRRSIDVPVKAPTSGPPIAPRGILKSSMKSSTLGVSSASNSISQLISGPPSIYDLPPIQSKTELVGGVIEYQPLQPTNYPASLKGGLFD